DLARRKIANRVANFELLGRKVQVVHPMLQCGVIPGRGRSAAKAESTESITPVCDYGFRARRLRGVPECQARGYSPLIPAVLMTFAQRSRSLLIRPSNSGGRMDIGVTC